MKTDIHNLERFDFKRICGIYQLYFENELIYIGKSIDINFRIIQHSKNKVFDKYSYFECLESELDFYEQNLIKKYLPSKNKCLNNDFKNSKQNQKHILVYNIEKRNTRKYYDIFSIKRRFPHLDLEVLDRIFNERSEKYEDSFVIIR